MTFVSSIHWSAAASMAEYLESIFFLRAADDVSVAASLRAWTLIATTLPRPYLVEATDRCVGFIIAHGL